MLQKAAEWQRAQTIRLDRSSSSRKKSTNHLDSSSSPIPIKKIKNRSHYYLVGIIFKVLNTIAINVETALPSSIIIILCLPNHAFHPTQQHLTLSPQSPLPRLIRPFRTRHRLAILLPELALLPTLLSLLPPLLRNFHLPSKRRGLGLSLTTTLRIALLPTLRSSRSRLRLWRRLV